MSEKNIKLVIAEKPSVAQSIAKVIGADKREDGYLEGNGYIVGFARTGAEAETRRNGHQKMMNISASHLKR